MERRSSDKVTTKVLTRLAMLIPPGILAVLFIFVFLLSGGCTEKTLAPMPKNPQERQILYNSTRTNAAEQTEETSAKVVETTPAAEAAATEPETSATESPYLEAKIEVPFEDLPYTGEDGSFIVLEGAYGPLRQDYEELIDWIRAMQAPVTTEREGPFEVYVFLDEQIAAVYDVSEPGTRRLVRAFPVSTGEFAGNTPLGSSLIGQKHEVGLMFDGSWGLYTSQLNGPVLFHSIPSYGADGHVGVLPEYTNNLGTACSHGCVRLMANASLFIYLYVPTGSQAHVLQNAADFPEIPEALEALKVPEDGPHWDPTNPNPENPYLQNPELLLEPNN